MTSITIVYNGGSEVVDLDGVHVVEEIDTFSPDGQQSIRVWHTPPDEDPSHHVDYEGGRIVEVEP